MTRPFSCVCAGRILTPKRRGERRSCVPETTSSPRTAGIIAGIVLIASTAAAVPIDPLFALFIIATGIALIAVSLTGFCIIGNVLRRLGFSNALGAEDSCTADGIS